MTANESWRVLRQVTDTQRLQKDLDSLTVWPTEWLLTFNAAKCKTMHAGKRNLVEVYSIKAGHVRTELQVEISRSTGIRQFETVITVQSRRSKGNERTEEHDAVPQMYTSITW